MGEKVINIIVVVFVSCFIGYSLGIGGIGWILSYIAVIITFRYIGIGEKEKNKV